MTSRAPDLTLSVDIRRAPRDVWLVVADPRRTATLSPEAVAVSGTPSTSGPMSVGERFSGANRNGIFRWSTQCVVVESTPSEAFALDVTYFGLSVARWRYAVTPHDGGSRVEEQWWDQRGPLMRGVGVVGTGVTDRKTHNAMTMRVTLDALRDELERTDP